MSDGDVWFALVCFWLGGFAGHYISFSLWSLMMDGMHSGWLVLVGSHDDYCSKYAMKIGIYLKKLLHWVGGIPPHPRDIKR